MSSRVQPGPVNVCMWVTVAVGLWLFCPKAALQTLLAHPHNQPSHGWKTSMMKQAKHHSLPHPYHTLAHSTSNPATSLGPKKGSLLSASAAVRLFFAC
jgi:hypothetical protein